MKFPKNFGSATLTAAAVFGSLSAEVVNLRPAQAVEILLNATGFTLEAETSFRYALDLWEPYINSSVPIVVDANFGTQPPGVLGSAGPLNNLSDFGAGIANTYYPVALANALSGRDLDLSAADITATFNSDIDWYYGTDPTLAAGHPDFVSTVLHEVAHGLGFLGTGNVVSGLGSVGIAGEPYIYDRFVVNGSGQSIIDSTLFPNNSTALASQLQSNNLFFNGNNARAANGGSNPKLYVPAIWEEGSSYSHLDQDTYGMLGNPNSLMTPTNIGDAVREPGSIALGVFSDIGYSVNLVEPTPIPFESSPALGLLLLGIGFGTTKLKHLKFNPNKLFRK